MAGSSDIGGKLLFQMKYMIPKSCYRWKAKKLPDSIHQRALQCHQYVRCENEAARNGQNYPESTLLSEAASKMKHERPQPSPPLQAGKK